LLFFDLTEESSFKNTQDWLNEIQEHTEEGIVVMLIGNKFDLVKENEQSRKISEEEAKKFAL
jgi:GTPase SAR1 family protein